MGILAALEQPDAITLYGLIETAKANRFEPYGYLTHIAARLPEAHTAEHVEALLPHRVDSAHLPSAVNDTLR